MPKFKVSGIMSVNIRYSWKKPGSDVIYYRRRVPEDLQRIVGKPMIVESTGTTDPKLAAKKIAALAAQHTEEWFHLRNPSRHGNLQLAQKLLYNHGVAPEYPVEGCLWAFEDLLEEKMVDGALPEPHKTALELIKGEREFSLLDARDEYKAARPSAADDAELSFKYLLEFLGSDRPLRAFRRADANAFVKFLLKKGLSTSSVQRYLTPMKAAIARAIRENELEVSNVLTKVEIPNMGDDTEDREVFSLVQFRALDKALAAHKPDTLRSILLVVSDTGARLAEIVGLAKTDLKLDEAIPHIALRPHPWRTLKTPGSTRLIPLTDRARDSLRAAVDRSEDPVLLYPHYTTPEGNGADTVSASLIKWMRNREGLKGTKLGNHSLRHGMRDLLRNVKCPDSAADQLIGHATPGMGANYGEGYPLELLHEWLMAANALKNAKE